MVAVVIDFQIYEAYIQTEKPIQWLPFEILRLISNIKAYIILSMEVWDFSNGRIIMANFSSDPLSIWSFFVFFEGRQGSYFRINMIVDSNVTYKPALLKDYLFSTIVLKTWKSSHLLNNSTSEGVWLGLHYVAAQHYY